ncbi:protein of unknown function [Streptomyces sp. KY70]|nr:protein of unknown function [Streptomyces sp. KY70]
MLGLEPVTARELLAAAACEVERTRAALAVVETAGCPTVARLTGDHQVLLSAALRRELVRHVDDCPRCRRAAERVDAAGPWPGATVAPATARLPLVEAPPPLRPRRPRPGPPLPLGRPALRPHRLPAGPQGPRRPPGPAARPGRDDDGGRHRGRRAGDRPVGRVPGSPAHRRGPRRLQGHRHRDRGRGRAERRPRDRVREGGQHPPRRPARRPPRMSRPRSSPPAATRRARAA